MNQLDQKREQKMPDVKSLRIMTVRRLTLIVCAGVALTVALLNSRAIMPGIGQGDGRNEVAAAAVPQAAAKMAPNPIGFADIVDSVKPAVIGVRVSLPVVSRDEDNGESPF